MSKSTYELQPTDIFRHPNGQLFRVTSIEEASHDNYKVYCVDKQNKTTFFRVDVHTQFDVVMSYKEIA